VFLYDCANAIWSLKGLKGPHLSILITFFHQKNSITLQRMQAFSILNWVIAVGQAPLNFHPLQDTPPIPTIDLLQVIDF
jgi:hypothetical protein